VEQFVFARVTRRFKWILYGVIALFRMRSELLAVERRCRGRFGDVAGFCSYFSYGEIEMTDLVDMAIPANAQAAAESMGLMVQRSMTSGTWVRRLTRDEAEIAVACLRDFGFAARIVDRADGNDRPPAGTTTRAA